MTAKHEINSNDNNGYIKEAGEKSMFPEPHRFKSVHVYTYMHIITINENSGHAFEREWGVYGRIWIYIMNISNVSALY